MMPGQPPIILVDDEGEENGLLDLFQMAVDAHWPGRSLHFYKSLSDACAAFHQPESRQ